MDLEIWVLLLSTIVSIHQTMDSPPSPPLKIMIISSPVILLVKWNSGTFLKSISTSHPLPTSFWRNILSLPIEQSLTQSKLLRRRPSSLDVSLFQRVKIITSISSNSKQVSLSAPSEHTNGISTTWSHMPRRNQDMSESGTSSLDPGWRRLTKN